MRNTSVNPHFVRHISQTFDLTFIHDHGFQSIFITSRSSRKLYISHILLGFPRAFGTKYKVGSCGGSVGVFWKVCFADRQGAGQWIYKRKRAFKNINEEAVHEAHCTTRGDHRSIKSQGPGYTKCALGYGNVSKDVRWLIRCFVFSL